MPFGEELNPDGSYRKSTDFKYGQTDSVRQRFTGYQKDSETNLDFAEARMYENRHGRFTAVDPLLASGKSANPQTFNRYVYVMNNPLKHTDPSGMQAATTPYWTYRDGFMADGTPAKSFYRFGSEIDQQMKEAVWGGESFKKWEGDDYYIFGDGTALYLGENATGAGFTFSTRGIDKETLAGMVRTQESGERFNDEQRVTLSNALVYNFNQYEPNYQRAKMEASIAGSLLASGTTATGNALLRNVAFGTRTGDAVFYSGQGAANYANQFALNTERQTIEMTLGGRFLNTTTNATLFGRSIRDTLPAVNTRMWNWGSRYFAEGASGRVTFFGGRNVNQWGTWSTIERPILQSNPNVTIQQFRVPFFARPN